VLLYVIFCEVDESHESRAYNHFSTLLIAEYKDPVLLVHILDVV